MVSHLFQKYAFLMGILFEINRVDLIVSLNRIDLNRLNLII